MPDLEDYNYDLPEELISKKPVSPRDSARLFVYDVKNDAVRFDTFRNLAKYLPSNSLLVFNDTKVVPARLWAKKETGGKVELLLLLNEMKPGETEIPALADRKLAAGQILSVSPTESFEVVRQDEKIFYLKPIFPLQEIYSVVEKYGLTPLPHYLGGNALSEEFLRERYQSLWAAKPASVAAPTASLHFTENVLEELKQKGIEREFVTLHVGLGTFAPIGPENFASGKLHTERYEVTEEAAYHINQAKEEGRFVISIGTTATRVLESCAEKNRLRAGRGETHKFIYPPYSFALADGLITNFHLPKTSLMLLVEAFLQHKNSKKSVSDLYHIAIQERFRFYSFGDGMLIL